jgi:predicted acylesterase/phospholipase RssA/CRP-like cAMP-binding protein
MVPTTALSKFALFAALSEAGKAELQSTSTLREFRTGETILTPGELGRFLYAIDTGTVSVQPTSAKRELAIILGPGEIFGEMSLLSGTPISAAVIAVRDCRLYEITARTFDKLFADEPAFRRGIADLLAQRLRLRTSDKQQAPICAFIALPPSAGALPRALARGVDHYARVVELGCFQTVSAETQVLGRQIDSWRASAHVGEICVVSVLAQSLGGLQDFTRPGDAVLLIDDGTELPAPALSAGWGLTDVAKVRVGAARHARHAGQADQTWSYRLEDAEIAAALSAPEWSLRATPVLDSIARWIARRSVGVALGSGAARGFAHVGVLDVLDAAGVPIDFLSGSSMGGIVALYYAITGSADGAGALVRSTLGSKKLIWDVSILPRLALFRGRKGRRSAERVAGGKYFPDLTRPAVAVAADLIKGERVVLDRGLVTTAAVATATIPGLFPPVRCGEQWLVDGAVVSRVPVDLLDRWRCGLKIAVNVELSANAAQARATLQRALHGLFGLRSIIARSWELLGVSHGAAETQAADIVINAGTQQHSGYDFDAIDSFISAGRAAAERKLPEILDAVKSLIRPRPR